MVEDREVDQHCPGCPVRQKPVFEQPLDRASRMAQIAGVQVNHVSLQPKARAVADVAKQVVARHRGPIRMVKHSIPHKAVQLTTRLAHQVLGAKRHRVVLIERGAEAIARAGSLQPLRSERHGLKPARWAGRVVILVALKADPHGAEQRVAVVDLTVRMSHEQREERAHMWVEEAVKILRVLDRLERHQRRDCVLAVLLGCQ
mmetsp:Transcript_88874/g.267329  ORF Transcript_88874/g.267329 Transcript_88874/m.267329 type:complete len:202 (+) Transcript_88874:1706-2311(+)